MAPKTQVGAGWSFTTLLLAIANVLIPLSILIFATGFFPYKPYLPGLAEYEVLETGSPPQPPFNKLIFMVIDALRRCPQQTSGYMVHELTNVIVTLYTPMVLGLNTHKG